MFMFVDPYVTKDRRSIEPDETTVAFQSCHFQRTIGKFHGCFGLATQVFPRTKLDRYVLTKRRSLQIGFVTCVQSGRSVDL